jgi:hypothetical protein
LKPREVSGRRLKPRAATLKFQVVARRLSAPAAVTTVVRQRLR